jgi:hypothetical protein
MRSRELHLKSTGHDRLSTGCCPSSATDLDIHWFHEVAEMTRDLAATRRGGGLAMQSHMVIWLVSVLTQLVS